MLDGVVHLGGKLYQVPSCSDPRASYTIDMAIGLCGCKHGMDGSPCKHQYLLWSSKTCSSPNFLPFTSSEERMYFSRLATGSTLPPEMYEGLHDRVLGMGAVEPCDAPVPSILPLPAPQEDITDDPQQISPQRKQEEARLFLGNVMSLLGSLIDVGDPALLKGQQGQ